MSLSMTRAEREAFLADLHIGVISIADGEHGPLTCPVWYVYEPGGEISLVTGKTSRKAAALRAVKRVSFLVQSEDLPYKYVSIEGPLTTLEDADLDKDVRPIAHRYLGREGRGRVPRGHARGRCGGRPAGADSPRTLAHCGLQQALPGARVTPRRGAGAAPWTHEG